MWNLKTNKINKHKVELIETESRKVVARGWKMGEVGRGW